MNRITNQVVENYSTKIADPIQRLKFQRRCLTSANGLDGISGSLWKRRIHALENIARTEPFSRAKLHRHDRALLRLADKTREWRDKLVPPGLHPHLFKVASACSLAIVMLAVVGIGFNWEAAQASGDRGRTESEKIRDGFADVWLVESSEAHELYSNGLEISNELLAHTGPRAYPVFNFENPQWDTARWHSAPVGLVFHTTESDLAEFSPKNNRTILERGLYLLQFVQREQLYNFVIDRFGRVHRIVAENEYAFHSGNSIWNDEQGLYLGLNQSFIGVAFESGGGTTPEDKGVTPAQIHGARLLTDWLRAEYRIPARNCVSHEMVSVNPANMLIGYHTDWAGKFPFEELGLPNNYAETLTSIARWGFRYDDHFVHQIGGRIWPGIANAEEVFGRLAARHETEKAYRTALKKQYRALLERIKEETPAKSWAEISL